MAIEMPLWMDPNPSTGVAPEYSARQDRGIIARLFTEGVEDVQAGMLAVAQRAAGANMTVEVAAGAAYVAGDDVARQGTYRIVVTSTETVTIGAAPASNSRIDLVVLRVRDATAIGGSAHGATVEVVAGTVAASPVAPAAPNTAIPLAQVLVASGTTSIVTANITDRRTQAGANTLRVGTQPQPMTTTQRDALSGAELYEGRFIYNLTASRLEIYRAGAWGATSSQLEVFTASGTWAKPQAARAVLVWVCGAGGGAGACNSSGSNYRSWGGGGGAVSEKWFGGDMMPATVPVTVGAPGTCPVGTTGGQSVNGTDGGYSAFGLGTSVAVVAGGGLRGRGDGAQNSAGQYGGIGGLPDLATIPTTRQLRQDYQGTGINGLNIGWLGPYRGGDCGYSFGATAFGQDSVRGAGGGASASDNTTETANAGFTQGLTGQQYAPDGGTLSRTRQPNVNSGVTTKPAAQTSRSGLMQPGDGGIALRSTLDNTTPVSGGDGQVPGGGGGALSYAVPTSFSSGRSFKGGDGGRGEVIVLTIF